MYKKISDYGIIGDLHSIALVGLDGSIDWMCWPYIDSPSIFAALLDDTQGGRFSISPVDEWTSVAEYIPGTNILQTRFQTKTGVLQITDFMPVNATGTEELEKKKHELYRLIEIPEGHVKTELNFEPQFNYARDPTRLEEHKNGITATGKNTSLVLYSSQKIDLLNGKATAVWNLTRGNRIWLNLEFDCYELKKLNQEQAEKALHDTRAYWNNWLHISETGRTISVGPYKARVERSALVLKLLCHEPAGTIAAAATTSLPEKIGGARNWDYRYTWVRDTSFTLQALFNLGHLSETEGYIRWIEALLSKHGVENMQILYGLRGEENLPEQELNHLDGYKGSRPVRIGNEAAKQKQLDIYGELMDAALKLSDYIGKIDTDIWPFLRAICDYVVDHWRDKDSGIWEVRNGPYEFVYSKVMCWVALDRGLIIAKRYGFPADVETWKITSDTIKKDVLKKGWNEKKKAFVQHYGTDALDASNLLLPILDFLPYTDQRILATIEATRRELSHDGFLYRYISNDGLAGGEGTFLLCTFWLITNLIALEKLDEAEALIQKAEGTANHLGLFSEEYDTCRREALGNFPQAFTHIGYINSVIALQQAKQKYSSHEKKELPKTRILLAGKIVLNDAEPRHDIPANQIAARLKKAMNVLRGAFFDTQKGRVAYERMQKSAAYAEYLDLSYALKKINLLELRTTEEQIAFWVNMYNVLVIHGVIELGIKDSVKEVRNIFKRIQYRIGDDFFSPDDIEHGILRSNRRPPNSLFRVFTKHDTRLRFSVQKMDPRIHFALVCASSSCPPIAFYSADKIDDELTIAAGTFLNSGGIKLDTQKNRVHLSRIFKWYAGDFGNTNANLLTFIAHCLFHDDDRNYLLANAEKIEIAYQDYDWRLNRY